MADDASSSQGPSSNSANSTAPRTPERQRTHYNPQLDLVYGKNHVVVRLDSKSTLAGYLTVHSQRKGFGATIGWSPFSQLAKYDNPDMSLELLKESKHSILIQSHNLRAFRHARSNGGSEVTFIGVDGHVYPALVFIGNMATGLVSVLHELLPLVHSTKMVDGEVVDVYSLGSKSPIRTHSVAEQTPHKLEMCNPPCPNCRYVTQSPRSQNESLIGKTRNLFHRAISGPLVRLLYPDPSPLDAESEFSEELSEMAAAHARKRMLERCVVAWRLYVRRSMGFRRSVAEILGIPEPERTRRRHPPRGAHRGKNHIAGNGIMDVSRSSSSSVSVLQSDAPSDIIIDVEAVRSSPPNYHPETPSHQNQLMIQSSERSVPTPDFDIGVQQLSSLTLSPHISLNGHGQKSSHPDISSNLDWEHVFRLEENGLCTLLVSRADLLRFLCENPCPESHRPHLWVSLLATNLSASTDMDALRSEYAKSRDEAKGLLDVFDPDETAGFLMEQNEIIMVDVERRDRGLSYYCDEADPNGERAALLVSLLRTYVFRNSARYVQGMSDIAEVLLAAIDDEVLAYHCLQSLVAANMDRFDSLSELGLQLSLSKLRVVLSYFEPDLLSRLKFLEADHLYFCYRWFLLDFKREFPSEQVFSLWEQMWASNELLSPFFPLFIALSLLQTHRDRLLACSDFGDIVCLFNSEAVHQVGAPEIVLKARSLYQELSAAYLENRLY